MRLKYFAGGVLKLGGRVARKLVAMYCTTSQTPPGKQERSSKAADSVADVGVC